MTAQPARQGAAPVARKKSKALPIAIAAALALVVIAAAAFGITRLFGTAAPSGEPVVTVPPSVGSVGEQVIFGTWRDEPLTWRVLAIEDRRALLISENVLTVRQYDDLGVTSSGQIDWNAAETTWA
ncbi:MAG: hypothetical protein LBO07_05340, partial [Coriobacteriales bacterium]|nr:hypothetical protein [Coriobacteriales bacterium]